MPWFIISQLAAYIQTARGDEERVATGEWSFS
jgi:hypothetical protein